MSVAAKRQLTVVGGVEAAKLLRLAEGAYLPEHFAQVLAGIERLAGPVKWLPFGGRGRVAHSAIGAASSSTHLLTEPVVNMGDAELELGHELALLRGEGGEPASTYAAASRFFGVPAGGLAAWDVRKGAPRTAFTALATRAQVRIRAGSRASTPTITYLDQAIGQHPTRFEKTLLSLHLGNKAEIPYLAGQYGHGAGLTLAFSLGGQVIVARRHPDLLAEDEDDLAGLVLIERRMPSETGMTNPSYWYAVPAASEAPLSFSPDALGDPRWHGVRRTCINYELAKGSERDIYTALDHYLTDPPLPYAFRDERTSEGDRRQWRFMSGNAARLERRYRSRTARPKAGTKEIRVPYRNRAYLDLSAFVGDGIDYGSVEIVTTFVKQEETGRGNSLFTPTPKEAEVWTLNGQVHHGRGRVHFGIEPIKLDAIRDFLIVEVKLDSLSADAKALLLTTDRQGAAEREIRRELERAIDDVLASDETLRRMNEEEKEEALSQAAQARMRDLDRELVAFEHFVRSETRTVKRKTKQWVRRARRRGPSIELAPLSPLNEHPTFVRFRKQSRQRLRVSPGATTSVLLEADAVDGYFAEERQPTFHFVPPMGAVLQVYAHERLVGGRMRVRIKARDDVEVGVTLLSVSYLPPNATAPLTDQIEVEIVAAAERKRRGPNEGDLVEVEVEVEEQVEQQVPPAYQVLFSDRSPSWAEKGMHHWSTETVGDYRNDVAYVNGDFAPLTRLLQDAKAGQQQEYLALYAAPIIMTLVGLAKQEANPPRDEDSGEPLSLHPDYKAAALNGVALSSIFTIRKLRKLASVAEDDEAA